MLLPPLAIIRHDHLRQKKHNTGSWTFLFFMLHVTYQVNVGCLGSTSEIIELQQDWLFVSNSYKILRGKKRFSAIIYILFFVFHTFYF